MTIGINENMIARFANIISEIIGTSVAQNAVTRKELEFEMFTQRVQLCIHDYLLWYFSIRTGRENST